MRVAVLGGGHGCYAAAVEMAERGHEVWFWRRDSAALQALLEAPRIKVTDFRGTRDVAIHHVCTDLEKAVAQAELILIPLPATAIRTLPPTETQS